MSRDWTGVKGIDPYMDNPELDNIDLADESAMKLAFGHTFRNYPREVELCGVCGRPPHPCDDPECVAHTAPIAEKLRVTIHHNSRLSEALKKIVAEQPNLLLDSEGDQTPVDLLVMDDLPNVAGRMHTSTLDFERRCRLYMQAEGDRVNTDMTLYSILCDAVRLVRELSPVPLDRYGRSDLYGCYQLHTVHKIDSAGGFDVCVPMPILPKSLIGKTVKVTIEECA